MMPILNRPSLNHRTVTAATANRIEADYNQQPSDIEAARALLTTPTDYISPLNADLCIGYTATKLLTGSHQEMIAEFSKLGIPVIFRHGGLFYDTYEEIPWK